MVYERETKEEALDKQEALIRQRQALSRTSIRRRFLGGLMGGVDTARGSASKTLNQAIDISVGDINPKVIIKYAIYLVILMLLVIVAITFMRGLILGFTQLSCGVGHALLGGGDIYCNPYSSLAQPDITAARFWMWDVQWMALCILYLAMAIAIGLILYQYACWLFNKLFTIDKTIKQIEDWIFGFKWEGQAEEEIRTRL